MTTPSPLKMVREFFGLNMQGMKDNWMPKDGEGALTDEDKAEILSGLTSFFELDMEARIKVLGANELPAEMKKKVLSYPDISKERLALINAKYK